LAPIPEKAPYCEGRNGILGRVLQEKVFGSMRNDRYVMQHRTTTTLALTEEEIPIKAITLFQLLFLHHNFDLRSLTPS